MKCIKCGIGTGEEDICPSCQYQDEIEREMLKEMDDDCAEDCQVANHFNSKEANHGIY